MAGRGAQMYLGEGINTAVFARSISTPPAELAVVRVEKFDDPGRMCREVGMFVRACLLYFACDVLEI